ncbi:hypothetical protein [Desulfoscipio geothermicus]|uniref:Uncharacterized protein n=1 Tax=Desulfoscipio geothermicus DSM 3669 TaxID=1121426 RepID=A0A1I6DY75_9FIRM|nr:hypothetical protein [Desulfoscipio geothermicus]SFR10480.1 hypothetical protein SAMN05660706_12120 [Desulfoscipio geothermicus DSM 3669]
MNRRELEKKLENLQEDLEDLKQERHFMLEKTTIHVPGHARHRYEAEIKELEEKIKEIEKLLAENK